jgi:hypothetical protein
LFGVYAFSENNYLNGAVQIFCLLLIFKAISDYWAIQKISDKKT